MPSKVNVYNLATVNKLKK